MGDSCAGFMQHKLMNLVQYHWSKPEATIDFTQIITQPSAILQLVVSDSGRTFPLTLQSGAVTVTTIVPQQTRYIALLLPKPKATADMMVMLHVPAFVSLTDARQLGVLVRSVTIQTGAQGIPAMLWLGLIVWLAFIVSVSAWLLRATPLVIWLSGAICAPLLFSVAIVVNASLMPAWVTACGSRIPTSATVDWRASLVPPTGRCMVCHGVLVAGSFDVGRVPGV
jgi:hypothetical protein